MKQTIKKILVAVDGSEGSCRAAAFAAELARSTASSLTLIHVLNAEGMILPGASALSSEELLAARDRGAEPAFSAARAAIGSGLELDIEATIGKPSMEIVRYAKENDTDLIVMGSRGRSDVEELLLGSVSSQVIHHAPCSVTIVR